MRCSNRRFTAYIVSKSTAILALFITAGYVYAVLIALSGATRALIWQSELSSGISSICIPLSIAENVVQHGVAWQSVTFMAVITIVKPACEHLSCF